jgi:hypothetical protein
MSPKYEVFCRDQNGAGKAVRAGLAVGGSISEPIRDRRATQLAGPFSPAIEEADPGAGLEQGYL